nr:hypothetical protein [Acinetobacter variabilis]
MRTFIKTTQMLALSLAAGLGFGFSTQIQAAASAVQVTEKAKSDYAKTKYPIVMVQDGVLASTENCNKNLKPKDRNGIYYYSWTGVAQATNALDIDTILMQLGPLSYGNKDNDGMVARCSAFIGKVINDQYKLNHTDLANMMFGLKGLFAPDPVAIYRQHANRLKLQNL